MRYFLTLIKTSFININNAINTELTRALSSSNYRQTWLTFENNSNLKVLLSAKSARFLSNNSDNKYKMKGGAQTKEFKRLPTNVVPNNYAITVKPNLNEFTFTGNEKIAIKVNEQTQQIVLNALELEISAASFIDQNGQTIIADKIELNNDEETASIKFSAPLSGNGQLLIDFNGILNDKLKGFYRSKYINSVTGEESYAATTQFESTYARRAFPCWDEPAIKATFDITLIVPNNKLALSNMNVISETAYTKDSQNLKEVKFATTPVMSTYLLAYIVGEYDFVEDKTSDGVLVRVYTPVGKKDQGLFALQVAVKALPYYKDYFNIPYPLPKMDLIALADFASGAMENWGLVTYREACLLVDAQNTSTVRKQWIALTVAHELAHQWFGNLVTMEWWTHLWLNEGFASFVEYLCVDYLFSEYFIWTQFVTDCYADALELDALHNSHPIEVPVGHPDEVDEIFDDISYNKGASVIRMLHRYLSDELFRKGMNLYLTRHSYKNTVTEDLWDALQEASNKPVRSVMSTWTKQKGFPVILVTARQSENARILSLTQEKFCANGKTDPSDANTLWMIPIAVSTASSKTTALEVLMEGKSLEVVIPEIATDEWVKLNPESIGVYRVNYSPDMLNLLLPAVSNKTLPPLDRFGLQNDLFAMVQSGRSSTVDILKLLDSFANEDNYTVWNSINSCLGKLNLLLSHTELVPIFHQFGRQLLAKTYSRLGWEPIKDENHFDTLLRGLVINRLAVFEDEAVLKQANKLFESHCNQTCVIPADLRSAVYRAVAITCDDKSFEALFKLYRETDLQEEKMRIAGALGGVKDPNRISKVLEFAMSNEVRIQDSVFIIIYVGMTKFGREMAWKFFQDNKDELKRRYEGGHMLSRLVKCVTENYASEAKAQEIEAYFAQNQFPGTERALRQAVETIRLNAEWLARDLTAITAYLSNRS